MKIPSAESLVDTCPSWIGECTHDQELQEIEIDPRRLSRRERKKRSLAKEYLKVVTEDCTADETEIFETDVEFCSRSEAICAELLRRFVPHFTLQQGVTFQVAIGTDVHGNTLAVDFLVDGVLFEYHPVRLFRNRRRYGDFSSKREYRAYTDICHSLRAEHREFFQAMVRARLTDNYYQRRRALLDQHPMYRRMELVVATSPEEFYHLILCRFGKNVPRTVDSFLAIFEELRESLPG